MKKTSYIALLAILITFQGCGSDSAYTDPMNSDGFSLDTIGNRNLDVNEQLTIILNASNSETNITYSHSKLTAIPSPFDSTNANIATLSGASFMWMPTESGVFKVEFVAQNQSSPPDTDSEIVTIAVFPTQKMNQSQINTVYATKCQNCHGADGRSGSANILIVDIQPGDVTNSIANIGAMNNIVVSGDEVIAISAYLSSL